MRMYIRHARRVLWTIRNPRASFFGARFEIVPWRDFIFRHFYHGNEPTNFPFEFNLSAINLTIERATPTERDFSLFRHFSSNDCRPAGWKYHTFPSLPHRVSADLRNVGVVASATWVEMKFLYVFMVGRKLDAYIGKVRMRRVKFACMVDSGP